MAQQIYEEKLNGCGKRQQKGKVMANLKNCKMTERDNCYLIEFEQADWAENNASLTLEEFPVPKDHSKGILLYGHASIPMYGAIFHKYHSFKFVAVFSPRDNGYKVVTNHGSVYHFWQTIKQEA